MRPAQFATSIVALSLSAVVAGAPPRPSSIVSEELIAQLWIDPVDLEKRDLFRGPSGGPPPPDPAQPFHFIKKDTSGRSPGYDARDTNGVVWSVKLGPEAQAEVVTSRLLWAIGFHQPPNHYLVQVDGNGSGRRGARRRSIEGWTVPPGNPGILRD